MHITEASIKRPVTSLMIFISFIVIGVIASRMVPLEYFPDISFPGAYVQVPYPGSTPEETERLITRPVEEALATISGIEEMNSDSRENEAGIFVRFKMGTDINMKSVEIREKIDGVRDQLPDDMERVFIQRFSAADQPIMNLRISSHRDLSNAYDLLNHNLKQRIERINGVSKVELYGVEKKQIRIELIADRVTGFNVNLNQVAQKLRQANFSMTAGRIRDGNQRFVVRPVGELKDADDIANLVIDDSGLRLRDIADVSYESPKRNYGRHLDQKYAIGLDVYKESGANTVAVSKQVMNEIDEVNKLPEMRGIKIYEMHSQAAGIISSLLELLKSGVLGALFSILVLYFFLRKLSTTLIVALAVPFSLIVTLGFLYFMGLTLNILSMMGLMLAIGMLVDNAVVITENIHSHQRKGDDRKTAAVTGVKEVSLAVTAGTLTTIIVFLPNIVSEQSMIAIQLYHVAITIIIALLASLLISQTIIPLLTSRMKTATTERKKTVVDNFQGRYGKMLQWLMHHRYSAAGLILLTIVSVAVPMKFMKMDMFPRNDGRELRLHFNINDNYVLDRVEKSVSRVEDYLYAHKKDFEIESVYSYYEGNFAQSTIILTKDEDAHKSVDSIKKAIEKNLPKLAIGEPSFEYQQRGGTDQLRVHLIGESSEQLEELSKEVIRRLERVPGLVDVRSEADAGNEEVQLVVDRNRARNYNLSTNQVADLVSNAMRGVKLRRIRNESGETDVILAFQDADRQSIHDLMNMPVSLSKDQTVTLASIADYKMRRGPQSIHRENRQTSLGITANLDDITMDQAKEQISRVMDQINYPSGYGWSYGRSFRQDEETRDEMVTNMLLALVLIYLVMAALFESVLFPSSIITSVFFAIIGVFWFFFITGTTFSFMAMIGILILMGIVVNNGIVLIDHINQLRAKGYSRDEAIIKGGMDRMRPILMTAGTTVLGLLPLCFGNTQIGGDGPPYFPMARAIVGGLTFSTVVTLVMLPSLYIMLDDLKNWSSRILRDARK